MTSSLLSALIASWRTCWSMVKESLVWTYPVVVAQENRVNLEKELPKTVRSKPNKKYSCGIILYMVPVLKLQGFVKSPLTWFPPQPPISQLHLPHSLTLHSYLSLPFLISFTSLFPFPSFPICLPFFPSPSLPLPFFPNNLILFPRGGDRELYIPLC